MLLKPSRASSYTNEWSSAIQQQHNINSCYLDVHSAANPSDKVDYDNSISESGKFRETLGKYRGLYSILRANHNGPIQGEGGFHFLYQGYVDDIEARISTPTKWDTIYKFPLLIDFDMLKLRSKTMVHGVGYYPLFLGIGNDIIPPSPPPTMEYVLAYIATELAFGHGGYIPDSMHTGISIVQHAKLEHEHVFSVQKDLVDAIPVQILYNDNGSMKSVSDYIRTHPTTYQDISNGDFMGQVFIEYNNGIIVYVNRHPDRYWEVNVGTPGSWFNYHANGILFTGNSSTTNFNLPPKNGWIVYDPLKTKVTFTNKIREINPGGKMLVNYKELIASRNYSYLRMGRSHNVKTQNERFVLDSIYKHNNWNEIISDNYLLKDFYLDLPNQFQNANFRGLNPVTIRNKIEDFQFNDSIPLNFNDPWYLKDAYGNQSGMGDFIPFKSPFSPTGAYNQTTGGVFLNQNPTFDPTLPNYSVKAEAEQNIYLSQTGRTHKFYFNNWSANPPGSANFQNENALETPVVFK